MRHDPQRPHPVTHHSGHSASLRAMNFTKPQRPCMWVILATAFFQVVILPGNLPFGFSQSFYSRKTSKMWLREGEGTVRAMGEETRNVLQGYSLQEALWETPGPTRGWRASSARVHGTDRRAVLPGELGADLLSQLQPLLVRLPGKDVLFFELPLGGPVAEFDG